MAAVSVACDSVLAHVCYIGKGMGGAEMPLVVNPVMWFECCVLVGGGVCWGGVLGGVPWGLRAPKGRWKAGGMRHEGVLAATCIYLCQRQGR